MIKIGIHQPNFCPWFPFFYKMAMCDKFVILRHVDFEKNNYQNRYKLSNDKWVTKSVKSGTDTIIGKRYADETSLFDLNMKWIYAIKDTLAIDTEILFDYPTSLTKTYRLANIVKRYDGDVYVTNPEAKEKYLDESILRHFGIEVDYCVVPKNLRKHTFEIFEEFGIDGAIKQLPRKTCQQKSLILLNQS